MKCLQHEGGKVTPGDCAWIKREWWGLGLPGEYGLCLKATAVTHMPPIALSPDLPVFKMKNKAAFSHEIF